MKVSSQRRDGFGILRVEGKLVRENQADLRACLEDLVRGAVRDVAIDLRAVDYLDSAGLGACASCRKMLKDSGGGVLVMFGASPGIVKMWKLIRLDLVIPSFSTEDAALEHLRAIRAASRV
jgi:anti-anti-sigma factor